MFGLIVVTLLFVPSILTFTQDFKDNYKSLCKRDHNSLNRGFKSIELLIEMRKKENTFSDSSLAIGFHFTKEFCEELGVKSELEDFTAYHSDNDYIYLYILANITRNLTTFSLKTYKNLITSLTDSKDYLFVIRLRELSIKDSQHIYNIDYNQKDNKKATIEIKDFHKTIQNEEQIILKDISREKNLNNISVTSDVQIEYNRYDINGSYFIYCGQREYYTDGQKGFNLTICRPVEENQVIWCECVVSGNYIAIYAFIVFVLCFLILFQQPLLKRALFDTRDPFVHQMQINCDDTNYSYFYEITLHLAKVSQDFNLDNVCIDYELFTLDNESIAPAHRFEANVLDNRIITSISIYMWRLTKLPEVRYIQANHSGEIRGRIALLWIDVHCSEGDDDISKCYKVQKNIIRDVRRFRLYELKEDVFPTPDTTLMNISSSQISLRFVEIVWILFVMFSLIAFVSFEILGLFHEIIKHLFLRMFTTVLIATPVVTVINILFIELYKYVFLKQLQQQALMNFKREKVFCYAIYVTYFLTILFAVLLDVMTCIRNQQIKPIETIQWLSVFFCSCCLFGLIWVLLNDVRIPRKQKTLSDSDYKSLQTESKSI